MLTNHRCALRIAFCRRSGPYRSDVERVARDPGGQGVDVSVEPVLDPEGLAEVSPVPLPDEPHRDVVCAGPTPRTPLTTSCSVPSPPMATIRPAAAGRRLARELDRVPRNCSVNTRSTGPEASSRGSPQYGPEVRPASSAAPACSRFTTSRARGGCTRGTLRGPASSGYDLDAASQASQAESARGKYRQGDFYCGTMVPQNAAEAGERPVLCTQQSAVVVHLSPSAEHLGGRPHLPLVQ